MTVTDDAATPPVWRIILFTQWLRELVTEGLLHLCVQGTTNTRPLIVLWKDTWIKSWTLTTFIINAAIPYQGMWNFRCVILCTFLLYTHHYNFLF